MANFSYTALTSRGERVEGVLAGESEQAILSELESRQLTPIDVKRGQEQARSTRGISSRKLADSYQQMADLLRAGVPLLRTLKVLGGRKGNSKISQVFAGLAQSVEKGGDLAGAMGERPEVFTPVHVAMVRAGEKGGFLEEVLSQLGTLVAKQAEMRSKIIGNLVYPLILIVMGVGIGGVIFGVFVPKFRPMLEKIKGGLPFLTKAVFGVSDAVTTYGIITAVVLAGVCVGVWSLSKKPRISERLERIKIGMPVIGPIVRGFAIVRLCRLLGTMLGNGVPMLAALAISKDGSGNPIIQRAIEEAAEAVKGGQGLAQPLERSGLFDDDILEMIRVGETANNLDEVLLKIAETVEGRLDRLLSIAIKLIEPLLLITIAVIVGSVAGGLLLPLTKLGGSM